jgi:hypothetical protein
MLFSLRLDVSDGRRARRLHGVVHGPYTYILIGSSSRRTKRQQHVMMTATKHSIDQQLIATRLVIFVMTIYSAVKSICNK